MQTMGKTGISCFEFVVPINDGDDENLVHWCWQSVSTGDLLYFSESLPPVKAVLLFGFCLYYVFAGRRALLCVF